MDDIRKGSCPLCGHNEIVEAPALVVLPFGVSNGPRERPLPIQLRAPGPQLGFVAAFKRALRDEGAPSDGRLLVYACRACGFAQSFVVDPGALPVGEEHGTRLLRGPEREGPYR